MSKDRFKIKFAVYLIARRGDEVLLSRRFNTGYMDGKYSLVSGHVDGGEPADEALIREVQEEAGVRLEKDALKLVYTLHRLKLNKDDEYLDLFFECRDWQGEFSIQEPEKCDALDWFDVNNLSENTLPYVRHVLETYSGGENYGSTQGEE